MKLPKPDAFVGGTLATGRLVLVRQSGSTARCGVLICLGTLIDNEDTTFDIAELGS
jgi:hypothetical protein